MANDENLLKGEATRFKSGEEAARNGRKGGIKSGITRRRKGASRKYLKELLAMTPCLNEKDMKLLEKMGVADVDGIDNEFMITLAMLNKAKEGDLRAYDMVHEYLAEDPHTMFEEKKLQVQKEAVAALKNSDGFLEAMKGTIEEVFEDGCDTPDTLEDTE